MAWYSSGDGSPIDIVVDLSEASSYTEAGGLVTQINNLGGYSTTNFTPNGTAGPLVTVGGFPAVSFDAGATIGQYDGAATYAAAFSDTTRVVFAATVYSPSDNTTFQSPFGIGQSASDRAFYLLNNTDADEGHIWRYHPHPTGTRVDVVNKDFKEAFGGVVVSGIYHNGTNQVTYWHNGHLLAYKLAETAYPAEAALGSDTVTIGAITSGSFPVNGEVLALGLDNDSGLGLEAAYAKYHDLYQKFAPNGKRDYTEVWAIGQSNAEGAFTNTIGAYDFSEGDDLYGRSTVTSSAYTRTGWGHSTGTIGSSSPGVWFCQEWQRLTGDNVIFTQNAFGSTPLIPGLSGFSAYWALNDPVHGAGQTSRMDNAAPGFARLNELSAYSPRIRVKRRIALIIQGESDAVAFNNSDARATQANFESYANAWLNELRDTYGVTHFAIVKPGRLGANQTAVTNNSPGVTMVRDAWDAVIAARTDAFDVYPNLNNTTYVQDNLVVDSNGYWVSGQANLADGTHYTSAQYKAIGYTSAYAMYQEINMTNEVQSWRGAVEPAGTSPSGNEIQLWRGAVEPAYVAVAAEITPDSPLGRNRIRKRRAKARRKGLVRYRRGRRMDF